MHFFELSDFSYKLRSLRFELGKFEIICMLSILYVAA